MTKYWAWCLWCLNRKTPMCSGCVRNAFAPCGQNKKDFLVLSSDMAEVYMREKQMNEKRKVIFGDV